LKQRNVVPDVVLPAVRDCVSSAPWFPDASMLWADAEPP
jgi:hypothetical protein